MSVEKKKLVVIGYGVAGSRITAKLAKSKKYEITVVTPFEYQEVS
jgi:NADH dehydrogenase FAD-containing subunit